VLSEIIYELGDEESPLGEFFEGMDGMLGELHQAEKAEAQAEAQLEQRQAEHRAQVSALAQIIAAIG
jgi:hypothetical protein